jgi:hypothetical protein
VTPAEELRAAAAKVRIELPGHLRPAPFIVLTDSESPTGIAFCEVHPDDDEAWEFTACLDCEVFEAHNEKLAALILSLLQAREPLAAWLEGAANRTPTEVTYRALLFARALNGGAS